MNEITIFYLLSGNSLDDIVRCSDSYSYCYLSLKSLPVESSITSQDQFLPHLRICPTQSQLNLYILRRLYSGTPPVATISDWDCPSHRVESLCRRPHRKVLQRGCHRSLCILCLCTMIHRRPMMTGWVGSSFVNCYPACLAFSSADSSCTHAAPAFPMTASFFVWWRSISRRWWRTERWMNRRWRRRWR